MILWERQMTCPTGSKGPADGLEVLLSPGGPGYPGQPEDVPPRSQESSAMTSSPLS
jgi:hypothetical protein